MVVINLNSNSIFLGFFLGKAKLGNYLISYVFKQDYNFKYYSPLLHWKCCFNDRTIILLNYQVIINCQVTAERKQKTEIKSMSNHIK